MHGDFILVDRSGAEALRWPRLQLGDTGARNEAWLRDTVFRVPELLPLASIDPSFGPLVPLCTELRTEAGPIDAAFVNPDGRVTVVECKLWRNPQARREVVAQIIDYARALTRWSYSDLQRQVCARTSEKGNVPFHRARAMRPELDESVFIDATARCLRSGRFLMLIVGDGIHEDIESIAELVNRNAAAAFQIALVEAALYDVGDGAIAVQPRVLARTKLVERVVTVLGEPALPVTTRLSLNDDVADSAEPVGRRGGTAHEEYRLWWQPVLDMRLDDPDQTPPVLHWPNNVRMRLPWPKLWVTAYRTGSGPQALSGVFLAGDAQQRREFWEALGKDDAEALFAELPGVASTEHYGSPSLSVERRDSEFPNAHVQREWIMGTLNAFTNALRPRMKRLFRPD